MLEFNAVMENRKKLMVRIVLLMMLLTFVFPILAQTAFAKNVYVITDGDRQQIHKSFASDPARVLSEAGVRLKADDLYTTEAVDGVSEITVRRARKVSVNYCGKVTEVCSYGETVRELLDRMEIPYSGEFSCDTMLENITSEGMTVSVSRVVHNRQTYTEELPFRTVVLEDDTLAQGEELLLSAGTAGLVRKTANVTYANTRELSRKVTEETVLSQAEDAVILRGTGKNPGGAKQILVGDGIIITENRQILRYSGSGKYCATAYTHTDAGCNMITATGTTVRKGVVAVDPNRIPYGTRMFIMADDGSMVYGVAVAEDCGGAIKGNRLDLYFDTTEACFAFGVRSCTAYFLK